MITKITKDNANLYTTLFTLANTKLNLSGDNAITSLQEYYSNIPIIVNSETLTDFEKARLLRLPLDEPTFDINANSRVITVPTEFAKNGISVEGDQYAEILYFTVDRYVDNTDLYSNVEIIIQWENANQEQGISKAIFKDSLYDEKEKTTKVVFGWALSSAITKKAGSIKFAVRFYKKSINNELIDMALNTLIATANIKSGLNYDLLETTIENPTEHITNYLKNSNVTIIGDEETTIMSATPTFIRNAPTVNLDLSSGACTLTVSAKGSDGGNITYAWSARTADGTTPTGSNSITYIPYDSEIDNDALKYVTVTKDGLTTYKLYSIWKEENQEAEDPDTLYVQVSQYIANKAGTYYATAANKYGKHITNSKASDNFIIPGPGTLTFASDNTITEVKSGTVTINAVVKEIKDLEDDVILTQGVNNTSSGDTLNITWSGAETETESMPTSSKTISHTIQAEDLQANGTTIGSLYKFYDVTIAANRNNVNSEPITQTFLITGPVVAPALATPTASTTILTNGAAITLSVDSPDTSDYISHEIKYQWYRDKKEDGIWNNNPYESHEEDILVGEEQTITVSQTGRYYCIISNVVNGRENFRTDLTEANTIQILSE